MANSQFEQFFWTKHNFPVLIDCNFIVDPANGNGLGIRSLKGPGVLNVFMHTTASFTGTTTNTSATVTGIASGTATLAIGMPVQGTGIPAGTTIAAIPSSSSITLSVPATASGTVTISYQAIGNPNPASGVIAVQLGENYFRYYGGFSGFEGPLSGTPINVTAGLTPGTTYVIVSVGTTTQAQWQALGLPAGVTAAVGIPFVATSSTAGVGTGVVETTTASGVGSIELIGDPNATFTNTISAQNGSLNNQTTKSPILYFNVIESGAVTAPATGTIISMAFYLSNSSVMVKGE